MPETTVAIVPKEEFLRFQTGTFESGNGVAIADMEALRFQNGTSKNGRGGNRLKVELVTHSDGECILPGAEMVKYVSRRARCAV